MKKKVSVVAAIVIRNNKYLCTQRGPNPRAYIGNKWEFPGGKVEVGESNEEALIRELKEELGITISVLKEYGIVDHEYPDFIIKMAAFLCAWETGNIQLSEHVDFKFLGPENLKSLDWAAADIPFVERLVLEQP